MTIHRWTAEEYHAHEALSAGMAWAMVNECPAQAWWQSVFNPEAEPLNHRVLDIGTAAHLAVLETHRFAERCSLIAADNYRTKAAQELRDACWAEGKTPLLPQDYELVNKLREALQASAAAELLFAPGDSEVSYTWDFDGVPCKARADRLVSKAIVDLKTAVSASPEGFARAMLREGHHLRAAFYLDGWNEIPWPEGPIHPTYLYVVVAKNPPHLVEVYQVGERSLEWGRRLYRKSLRLFRECQATGMWPGYGREPVTSVELPVYAEHQLADLEAAGELAA
jgi:hypothetical protein